MLVINTRFMMENSALMKQLRAEMKRKVLNGISTNKQFVENVFTWKQLIPTNYLTKKRSMHAGRGKKSMPLKFKKCLFLYGGIIVCKIQNPLKYFQTHSRHYDVFILL